MDISVIIVNYRSEQFLADCFESLAKGLRNFSYEIIMVNNEQGALKNFKATEYKNLQIINRGVNDGYAKACNEGATQAKGNILFFLNPDTKLLEALDELVSMLQDETVAIVAPKLVLSSGEVQPWSSGNKLTFWSLLINNFKRHKKQTLVPKKNAINETGWVSGAAFVISKKIFNSVGGFDENYFMYFEDMDLCNKIKLAGYKILVNSKVLVLHIGGQSYESTNQQKKDYYQSQDYYFKKNFGFWSFAAVSTLRKFLFLTNEFKTLIQKMLLPSIKKIFSNPKEMLFKAFVVFCALLPFQFALSPFPDVDLAVIRIIIPLLFIASLFICWEKNIFFSNKTTRLLLTIAILAIFSLSYSFNIFWSLRKLFFLISIVPIYFVAIATMRSCQTQRMIIKALVFGGAALSMIAIAQFFSQFVFGINPVYDFIASNIAPFFLGHSFANTVLSYPSWLVNSQGTTFMRAIAVFPDPHMLSYYMGILIPWSLALGATSKKHAFWFYLATLLLFIADICTFTRGGYIALIAGSFAILPLVSKTFRLKIIVIIALIFSLYSIAPNNPVAGRLTSSFDVQEGSNQGRLSNWEQALVIIKNHPQGVGIGMYPLAVDPKTNYRQPIYAHNLYLDIAAELGILAAILFIAILNLAFLSFWRAAKLHPFFIAGASSIVIFSVHSLVETPLYSVHVLPVFLIILALSTLTKKYASA